METKKYETNARSSGRAKLTDITVKGWLGRDKDGEYSENPEECIKFLHHPASSEVNFDLRYEDPADEEDTSGYNLDYLYRWITGHSKDEHGNPCKPRDRFIVYRFELNTILESPYANSNKGWNIYALRLKGTIYLRMKEIKDTDQGDPPYFNDQIIIKTWRGMLQNGRNLLKFYEIDPEWSMTNKKEKSEEEEEEESPLLKMFTRYGIKFEQNLLSTSRTAPPNPRQPVTKNSDMGIVMHAELGGHTLLYSGEADGVPIDADLDELDKSQLFEIKSVRVGMNPRSFKRYKLLKFWAQSLLARCDVLLGYRDDKAGFVRKIEQIKQQDISHLAEGLWEPEVCLRFLLEILDTIEEVVSAAPEETLFGFEWTPFYRQEVLFTRFPSPRNEEGALKVMPLFYEEWLKNLPIESETPDESQEDEGKNEPVEKETPGFQKGKESVNFLTPSWAK